MFIVETCLKCRQDLQNKVICFYPPILKKVCWNCGWSWTVEADRVTRVPFNPDSENSDSDWIKDTEGDKLNYTNVGTIYNTAFNNEACKNCSNNPKNGGSGICNCTLGLMTVTC